MNNQENDKVLLSVFTPEDVEAAFHVSVKNFLTKKQQALVMNAFRNSAIMSNSVSAVEQRDRLLSAASKLEQIENWACETYDHVPKELSVLLAADSFKNTRGSQT